MLIFAILIGIIVMAILIVHIFLVGNALEKSSVELREDVEKYYLKKQSEKEEE